MAFEALFQKYDRLVLFDTETTGLQYNRDEIIEELVRSFVEYHQLDQKG